MILLFVLYIFDCSEVVWLMFCGRLACNRLWVFCYVFGMLGDSILIVNKKCYTNNYLNIVMHLVKLRSLYFYTYIQHIHVYSNHCIDTLCIYMDSYFFPYYLDEKSAWVWLKSLKDKSNHNQVSKYAMEALFEYNYIFISLPWVLDFFY